MKARSWALIVHTALLHAAYAALRPMASYRAIELHAGTVGVGLLSASFAVLPLLLALPLGRLADRIGATRLMVAGSALFGLAGVAGVLTTRLPLLLAASAVLGVAMVAALIGQQSATAMAAAPADRDRAFGSLTSAAAAGQLAGPVIVGTAVAWWAASWGTGRTGIAVGTVLALASLGVAPVLLRFPRATVERRPGGAAVRLVRVPGMWRTLVSGGLVLAALDLLLVLLPLWASGRDVSAAAVGWLLALRAAVTLAVRLFIDRAVARVGRRVASVGSIALAGAGLAVLPFVALPGAVVVMVVLGVGLGVAQPLTMSAVADLATAGALGAAMGIRMTVNRLAQTVVPVAIGVLSSSSGVSGAFWGTAAMLGGAAAVLVPRPRSR